MPNYQKTPPSTMTMAATPARLYSSNPPKDAINRNNGSPGSPRLVAKVSIDDGSESCPNANAPDTDSALVVSDSWFGPAAATSNPTEQFYQQAGAANHIVQDNAHPLFPNSSSMEFNFIREEDAYILEQGVEDKWGADLADFDDEGRRLETSESNGSLSEFEDEDVAAGGEELDRSSRSQRGGDGVVLGGTVDESRIDLPPLYSASSLASPVNHAPPKGYAISASTTSSTDILALPAIAEDSICHTPRDSVQNSLPQSHIVDNEPVEQLETLSENDYFLGPSPSQRPSTSQATDNDHEALARRLSSGHQRSDSFNRRMSESAQFAEAVGEASLLLKKIIEEDSSSDFDDDDIDEGGKDLAPHQEDQAEGLLLDHGEELQNIDGPEEDVSTGAPKKMEPICVSTDLSQISSKEEGISEPPMSQQQGGLTQLSSTLEVGIVHSAPTTPHPLPSKPKGMVSQPTSYVDWKFTRQRSSSSNLGGDNTWNGVLASSSGEADFVYRGIRANPPEITKRGMARGNYAQLHRKAWLEVSDKHHRYGKNLRMYYKHWEALGHPYHLFFDWLDSKGEAVGSPLPNLPEIPRPVLDSDTVLYITNPEISASYALSIVPNPTDGSGIIIDQNGNPINTGKEGWIFILRDHVLYGSQKVTAPGSLEAEGSDGVSPAAVDTCKPRQRFHHSSFFGGKAVASAGIFLTNEEGRLTRVYPHSGHYRPGEAHMQRALFFFQQHGVELSTFSVDMQQIFKVSRKFAPKGSNGEKTKGKKDKGKNATENEKHPPIIGQGEPPQNMKKSKKTDCLHLMGGLEVAWFLAHKAIMIEKGVFHQVHKIRRIPKESRGSVSFVMSFVNN